MEDTADYPICTLKVDFGCSKGCPVDVRNMLQRQDGVKSISIDPNKGMVTVTGNVEPTTLIKLFEKMGKKAQLYSFVKEPKKSKHHKHKDSSHCCESSDSEEGCDHRRKKKHDQNDHRFGYGHHGNPYTAPPGNTSTYQPPMFGNPYTAPPPVTRYHNPPMPGYHYQPFSGHHYPPPPMAWNQPMGYARPPMYPRSRPPMYGGYYGHGQQPMWPNYGSRLPRHNPMIHYNSYADNYRYMM